MPGAPSRMISRILVYGPALNHDWLGTLQEHSDIPIAILNATETPGWQVDVSVPKFNPRTAYRYTEPLANIF